MWRCKDRCARGDADRAARSARGRASRRSGRLVRAARRHEQLRVRRRHGAARPRSRHGGGAASDPVRAGPDPRDRRQVLDHPRSAFSRQRARLPRAGRALFVRSAAGGGAPRPTLDPRHGPDGGPVSDTTTTPTQKGDRRMTIGLILVSVTLAAIAQVTLKMGMNHVTDANGGQLALTGESLKQILTTLLVWVGLGIFAISAVLWLFALSRASLSFAYPFAALGYVIIVAASILFLDEHVPPLGWAGVACIVV